MNFIEYEDNTDNLSSKLEIQIGTRKYFENFDDEIVEDSFNPFNNPSQLESDGFNLFSSLLKEESNPNTIEDFNHNLEQQESFQNMRIKREEMSTTSDDFSISCNIPDRVSTKSKRIQKREKAKQRNQAKVPKVTEEAIISGEIPSKYIPKGFNQANLDEKTRKKMLQMIRNRISAQNSRDRKKNLIETLENQQRILSEENLMLKCRVRQLEEMNAQLQKENQEFKKSIKNQFSQNASKTAQQLDFRNSLFQSEMLAESPFENSETTTNPSNQSPGLSETSSPIIRGMNPATVQKAPGTMLSVLPQQHFFQVQTPKSSNQLAFSDDTFKDSIVVESKSKDLMVRMEEEEIIDRHPCISTNLQDYPFINQLGTLQQNFNEKHMNKFFNQLKLVLNPIALENNQKTLSLNTPNQKALMEYDSPSYLRSSRKQLPDYSKPKDPSETQLALPHTGAHLKHPALKRDNFSSVFCPTGFEFQTEEDDSYIKLEDGVLSDKKIRVKDAEWLQLFIPKNNVSVARIKDQSDLIISSPEEEQAEDNTILEIWCKIFYVRELPSNI